MDIHASYLEIPFSLVDCDPDQPRQHFDEADITNLQHSIEEYSLLQEPILKAHPRVAGRYMIVAGESRFRAMQQMGLDRALFKVISGRDIAKSYILSAIENLLRRDLNPIDEAMTYRRLHDEEGMSWEKIARMLGKDLGNVLNKIKLLALPPEIQELVRQRKLPQVTVLNLTQWRGEKGDFLRMAHDLVAGRDPAEAHFREETERGALLVQAKLPRTTDDFARRIVRLSGKVQSMPAVLRAFLDLPPEEQEEILAAIHPSVLGKLRIRFAALFGAAQAFSERINNLGREGTGTRAGVTDDATTTERTRMSDAEVEAEGRITDLPEAAPAPARPTHVTAKPASAVAPVSPRPMRQRIHFPVPPTAASSRPAASAPTRVVPAAPLRREVPVSFRPGQAARRASANGGSPSDSKGGVTQSLVLSQKVLTQLFFADGYTHVDFSRTKLRNILGSGVDVSKVDDVVLGALTDAESYWRAPPQGGTWTDEERKFVEFVTRLRRSYGNARSVEDFLFAVREQDRSPDPVIRRR